MDFRKQPGAKYTEPGAGTGGKWRGYLFVEADDLLTLRRDAGFDGGDSLCVIDQRRGIHIDFGQCPEQARTGFIAAGDPSQSDMRTEASHICRHVGRPARDAAAGCDCHYRHGCFRRNPRCMPRDIFIEHHVSYYQNSHSACAREEIFHLLSALIIRAIRSEVERPGCRGKNRISPP